jgi:hypothetical protein
VREPVAREPIAREPVVKEPAAPPGQRPAPLGSESGIAAEFTYSNRRYSATTKTSGGTTTLTISNPEGQQLVVNRGDAQGWLYAPGEPAKPVDLGEPGYGNLVRAGAAAVEIQQLSDRLAAAEAQIAEQDLLLAQQNTLIAALQQENGVLMAAQTTASHPPAPVAPADPPRVWPPVVPLPIPSDAPAENVAPTAAVSPSPAAAAATAAPPASAPPAPGTPPLSLDAAKQQVRHAVTDKVWFCLSPASQTDLARALAHLATAGEAGAETTSALRGLVTVLERELWQPLLDDFAQYGAQSGDRDMVALASAMAETPGLGLLPPLISERWRSLTPKALAAAKKPTRGLHHTVTADSGETPFPIDDGHRVMLDEFLQGWEHPIARWLIGASGEAAADLAQLAQIHGQAAGDRPPPLWQCQMAQQLVLGHRQKKGILQKIFG